MPTRPPRYCAVTAVESEMADSIVEDIKTLLETYF